MPKHFLFIPAAEILAIAKEFKPTHEKMEATAFYMKQQVLDRFSTQGTSGGTPWPIKRIKSWGYDDGRAILTGRSAGLLESFQSYGSEDEAVVFSDLSYSKTHQLGTVGKGGSMPTIVPKRVKALFIPITDRAASSDRIAGAPAVVFRKKLGMGDGDGPLRIANRGPKLAALGIYSPLVKGRLKDGKLEKWDAATGTYVPGTPDFLFLKKVDISPRPMLPTSPAEREAQAQFVADILVNG